MPTTERSPQRFACYSAGSDLTVTPRTPAHAAGIVLAGTHRWGDSPFAHMRGPLVPVALSPLIHYPLTWLRDGGIGDAVICANTATDAVAGALGAGARFDMQFDYYEDRTPRGAAGCVRDAALQIDADTLIVVEGALIPSVNIAELLETHRASGAVATVVTEIDRRQNTLARARASTPGGIYVFDRAALEFIPRTGFQDIKEGLLERLYRAGAPVAVHEVLGVAPRVIDYASYMAVNRWLIDKAVRERALSNFHRQGDTLRHPTAVISPEARLVGPVLVGAGARIERDAIVVGPTVVGPSVEIRAGALVARSILWRRSIVRENAIVDGSLVGDGADIAGNAEVFGGIHLGATPDLLARSRPALSGREQTSLLRVASAAILGAIARELPIHV